MGMYLPYEIESFGAAGDVVDTPVRRPSEKRTQSLTDATVVIDDDNLRGYGSHAREAKAERAGPLCFAAMYM